MAHPEISDCGKKLRRYAARLSSAEASALAFRPVNNEVMRQCSRSASVLRPALAENQYEIKCSKAELIRHSLLLRRPNL
jgi:hypothetical protein